VPFGFRKQPQPEDAASREAAEGSARGVAAGSSAGSGAGIHAGPARGVGFTALTEDWRLRGRMQISGRLSDALNRREGIAISDVDWGPPEAGAALGPAPGLKSVDPYDLILVTGGDDSLPPLTETEQSALKVHKVPYDVALEVPPFRVVGRVFLHPGDEPERLLDRSTEMFLPVIEATAWMGEAEVSEPGADVILVNRFYLREVGQVDRRTFDVPPVPIEEPPAPVVPQAKRTGWPSGG
jgi:hypothetical protein